MKPIVIDERTQTIVEQTWYVAGENVPAQKRGSTIGASTSGRRAFALAGDGSLRDLEALAFDAAQALREWFAHAKRQREAGAGPDLELVRGYIDRVVDESRQRDGISAWVLLDGDKPSPRTIQEYRGSVRDVLLWLAARGICPAETSAEDMKAYKAWLQADGAPTAMEMLRARWYGREPRIVYESDWRGPVGLAAWRGYAAAAADAEKAKRAMRAAEKRQARQLARLAEQAAAVRDRWRASVLAIVATYADQQRAERHSRYTADTVSLRITLARNFWKMALSRQAVFENPLLEIRVGKNGTARAQKIISRFFSDAEVLAVLALCDESTARSPREKALAARNTAIIRLMRNQGLRISEVANLDMDDFNPTAGEAGSLLLRHAKGDKSRTVLLTERTRASLDKWLAYRELLKPAGAAVFVTLNVVARPDAAQPGARMNIRGIRDMFDELQKKAGIKRPGRSAHGLRHAYATRAMMEDPGQLIPLSLSMGHSSPTITMGYVEASELINRNPAKLADI